MMQFPGNLIAGLLLGMSIFAPSVSDAAQPNADTSRGDEMLAAYFRSETQKLAGASLADIKTWDDWTARRERYRQQLREMLGLEPLPERTPLQPVVTGTLEHDDFKVEKLYFQSRPHLYVTANLYLPKKQTGRVPAILYLCGHSLAKKDGVSLGNKTKFQHHGAWFARNGYVCLVIDTLQMGEIEGLHHGTYRENMWWWNARGYTPAGVEAWNAIRAIDYLVSRPEVDPERIGVTGRSGGGAYSWFVTALDDRIKAAVPVAGITTLKNHVVDGCVERHCDCMFYINTYRWDFPQLAALAAPRPLLISNTDRDELFPLDGVLDVYRKVRRVYELADSGEKIALQIAAGPHDDSQVLQLHALTWFNKHLKGEDLVIETVAKDFFKPEELKVFDKLPADQINNRIHESFVPPGPPRPPPASKAEWQAQRDSWMAALREKCFAGWPAERDRHSDPLRLAQDFKATADDFELSAYHFDSQNGIRLPLYVLLPNVLPRQKLHGLIVMPVDERRREMVLTGMRVKFDKQIRDESLPPASRQNLDRIRQLMPEGCGLVIIEPRGFGETRWGGDSQKQTHIRRRFMLLGQTLDAMRVWDIRRGVQALRAIDGLKDLPISLVAGRDIAAVSLYAALFGPRIDAVQCDYLPKSHRQGPDFLNVMRFFDAPQALAMVEANSHVILYQDDEAGWEYPVAVSKNLGWKNRIEIRQTSDALTRQ